MCCSSKRVLTVTEPITRIRQTARSLRGWRRNAACRSCCRKSSLAVAHRLELPIVGLALPGKFMVRYDDRSGAAHPIELIIDSFEGGKVLTMAELREFLPDLSGDSPEVQKLFEPAGNRMTLVRVLNNLSTAYLAREDFRQAAEVEEYRQAVIGALESTMQ